MFYDSHVHSAASPDSEMRAEEAVAVVKKMGLGIAFTEHVDFAFHDEIDPNATDAPRGIGDFVCDFDMYPSQYRRLREDGVTLGLEIGLTKAFLTPNAKLAADDYDFIIGSVHGVDGVDIYRFSIGELDEPLAGIARYLEYSREMVELCGFFDSFGHIDYIARYIPQNAENFFYENLPNEFDALLKVLAERELALEINTSSFGKKGLAERAYAGICKRFALLGGRLCTIGSDAHNVNKLGWHFKSAKEIANEAGLSVVYYKERKPIACEK